MIAFLLTLEGSFIFFITIYFFVSLYINVYIVEKGNYTFSFGLFFFLVANIFFCHGSVDSFFPYELWGGIFSQTSLQTHYIKLALVIFQFIFFVFILIAYKSYLQPEIFYFFNISLGAALFIASTNDWIITFILFELASIPTYVLIAIKKDRFALEAALKYLIFGAFASQFFILSFIFYANKLGTNTIVDTFYFSIFDPSYSSSATHDQIFALFFVLSIFIKFGVGPFYTWLIDVYQASSYPMFVYSSTISKLIAFIPLFTFGSYFCSTTYYKIFFILLLLYSSLHSVVRIFFENNIRKFFGYSSVINFSFLIIINFITPEGTYIFFKYIVFYCFILFGLYGLFEIFRLNSFFQEPRFLDNLNGTIDRTHHWYFSLALVLSSGLPPLGIFYAKAYTYGLVVNHTDIFSYSLGNMLIFNSLLALFAYGRAIAKSYNFGKNTVITPIQVIPESDHMLAFSLVMFTAVVQISLSWNLFLSFLEILCDIKSILNFTKCL